MSDTIRVDLHCHSICSDGELQPEELAAKLAQAGVRFAALTDHHTLDGLERFREAAAREGVGAIPGVEISAEHGHGEVHLLAYGFDPESAELRRTLEAAGRTDPSSPEVPVAPRRIAAADVIRVVHDAGGRAFLAHPLSRERGPSQLAEAVQGLRSAGLDGIEAIYAAYDQDQTRTLLELADASDLLVSGGSDFHASGGVLGVDLPRDLWARFRNGLFAAASRRSLAPRSPIPVVRRPPVRLDWTGFFLRILLPALLAITLLIVPVFAFVIPAFEEALLARKREMIRELTNSATSILAEYHEDEKQGRLGRTEAQRAAAGRIQFLRYGKEGKDYFWITDQHPRMVMHPYRTDLNGKDVSGFRDPNGNQIFMEFLRVVRQQQEGYVEYVWQWKDDPTRLAPKQSYVRGFEPWGWVIGTGIYMEDVRTEISAISGRIIRISVALVMVIALLLLFVAQQSLRLERRRRTAEEALRESHEKYRALVEASTEGTMLVVSGRISYANQTLLEMLGYSEDEIPLLEVGDVVLEGPEIPDLDRWLAGALQGARATDPCEVRLRKKNGDEIDVLLTVESLALAGRPGCILMARDLSLHKGLLAALDESRSALRRMSEDLAQDPLHPPLLSLHDPVVSRSRPLPTCEIGTRIRDAAALMAQQQSSAILVTGPGGEGVGVITDSDLRSRVVGRGLSGTRPVHEIMSAPVVDVAPHVPGALALLRMRDQHLHHLVVRGGDGQVAGVVRDQELLESDLYPLASLARSIGSAAQLDEVVSSQAQLPQLVQALVDAGAKPRSITGAITAVTDAVTQRLLDLAIDELGPPPAPYAFIALGSQGRVEQTLASDQDNALVYESQAAADPEADSAYFLALGQRVCEGLARAGYAPCKGQAMASNPRYCAPLAQWKDLFSGWVNVAEPRDLLEFNIFFDFRWVHGQADLVERLRGHVMATLSRTPSCFVHLAQNALHHKPLLGFFGNIVAESGDGGSAKNFNVKEALAPIVSFARLYSLRAGLGETSTFDRIERLGREGILTQSLHDEVALAYQLLVSLRLRHQSEAIRSGLPPGNQIGIATLTRIEQTLLKEVLSQITGLQRRIASDFLGGAWTQSG